MEARKKAEAEAAMIAGAKCLKTSMLGRWKPDWELAAVEYEKAAVAFRVAKAMPQAIGAFTKLAEAHEKSNSLFAAAKHFETAALLAKDLKQTEHAAQLYEKSSALHVEDGRVDDAASALVKGARAVEAESAQRGSDLMLAACDLFDDADLSQVQELASLDTYKAAVQYLLRSKQYARAATLLRRQALMHVRVDQPHGVAVCELSRVVVLLKGNDYEAAAAGCDEAQARGDGFGGNDEAFSALELLDAYARQDAEAVAAVLSQSAFSYLDNAVSLLAKTLTLETAAVPGHKIVSATSSGRGGRGGSDGGLMAAAAAEGAGGVVLAAPTVEQAAGDFGEVAPEDDPSLKAPPEMPAAPPPPPPLDDDDDLT